MEEEGGNHNHQDPFHAILPTATVSEEPIQVESLPTKATRSISLPNEPIQVLSLPTQTDNGARPNKSASKLKPSKIAAYNQQGCQPWLKLQEPCSNQANFGYEVPKQQPKLEPTGMMKEETAAEIVYKKVMETVANKTRGLLREYYDDDSVHVKLLELWKLKMMKYEAAQVCPAANVATSGLAIPSIDDLNPANKRMKQCSSGTSTQEKATPLIITSIPLGGEPFRFQCFPANRDIKRTNSKSAANRKLSKIASYERQPRRPWLANAGFEEAQSKSKLYPGQVSVMNSSSQVHAAAYFQQLKNSADTLI